MRLSRLQSVLNAAARLIVRLPRFSHISTFMFEQLHWLPLTARIQLKVLVLICRSYLGLAPKYVCDSIRRCIPMLLPFARYALLIVLTFCSSCENSHSPVPCLCLHWPFAMESTSPLCSHHHTMWWSCYIFPLPQNLSLFSRTFAL